MHIIHRKKTALFVAFFVLEFLLLLNIPIFQEIASRAHHYAVYRYFYADTEIHCYRINGKSLTDISDVAPKKGKSIFFHETSCNSYLNGKITIGARQACAVESAARMNPNLDVHLLYASPGQFVFEGTESDRFLKALMSYTNINILHVDYERYIKNTPLEYLYQNGSIEYSSHSLSHASDVFRYLTMWKFGGIYLDLDVIVIKSLENLPPNFAGIESNRSVAAGVMGFAPTGVGHQLAKSCLKDLRNNFNGQNWGRNGPGVITRLLKSVCETETVQDMPGKDCKGFKVFPTEAFYAVPWRKWRMYFNDSLKEDVINMSANSYVVHAWNKHSGKLNVSIRSQAPYLLYGKRYCPKVVQECQDYF